MMIRKTQVDKFDIEPKSMVETEEGFLTGDAYVTRIGVFPYLNIEGDVYYQLRHPDDVFKEASLDTMKLIPMTLEHPKELLDKDNTFWHQIGFLGENIRVADDNRRIIASYKITDPLAIDMIKERSKIEISMGYTLDLILEDGEYDNIQYSHRQTNIRYNHCALVEKGRAGSDVKIVLDSMACFDSINNNDYEINSGGTNMKLVKVQLDNGISYDAEAEVKIALDSALKDKKALEENLDSVKAEKEKISGELDSVKAEFEKLKNKDHSEEIAKEVKARSGIIAIAEKVLDSKDVNLDDMSNKEIKIACIEAHRGNDYKVNSDSEDYINGLWSGLTFSINADAKNGQIKAVTNKDREIEKEISAEEARQKMMDAREAKHKKENIK